MDVGRIRTWAEASPYLDMLASTVTNDVTPLLNTQGGAPHTVSREVCSYADYLGALFVGTPAGMTGQDGLAQVGIRFKRYLREVMGLVDPAYHGAAEVMYQMYRNGPAHEFDPKVLENKKGQWLAWLEYRGARRDNLEIEGYSVAVQHLKPLHLPSRLANSFHLPVSTLCLIQDLLGSIEYFKTVIGTESERVNAWNEAAAALDRPKQFEFTLPL